MMDHSIPSPRLGDFESRFPEGWSIATLGEVTEERVSQSGASGENTFTYVDISSVDNKAKKIRNPKILGISQAPSRARQNIETGDVLVSMTRPNLNAVAKVPESMAGAVCSTGFHVLRAVGVDSGWLFAAVQSPDFVTAMAQLVQGALYPAVRPRDIQNFVIPIPPLPEQRRIVAEIETQFTRLDAAVAALERARANLKRYRAAVLADAVRGDLIDPRASFSQVGSYVEDADVPFPLPPQWSWRVTKDICISIENGNTPPPDEMHTTGEIPYLKVYNLTRSGKIDFSVKPTFVSRDIHEGKLRRSIIRPGDVLMNIVGPPLGKVGLVTDAFPEWNTNQAVVIFRPGPELLAGFLCFALLSEPVLQPITKQARATAGQFNISLTMCRNALIPVPPLIEQERIVEEIERRLSIAEDIEAAIKVNLKRADRLRQAVLRKAFAGELVPHDSDDEPASILLDRIRSDQQARSASKTGRKRSTKVRRKPVPKAPERKPILEVLRSSLDGMSPDELFRASGHSADDVDEFYAELREAEAAGAVAEERKPDRSITLRSV